MTTAIVLLNYNSLDYFKQFLPTLVETKVDATIYIIDNASTDESQQYVEENFPDIKWIQLNKNYGYAGGYAKGLDQLTEDIFILMNTDIEVTNDWLQAIIQKFQDDENLGACMPKILDQKMKSYFEYAGAAGGEIDYFGYPFCRGRIFDTVEEDKGQYDDLGTCFWASGACLAVRRDAYYNALGLDPRFFAHMEEIDLCWRLQRIGYSIKVATDSIVYHVGGGTLSYENPRKMYLNFRNNLILCAKNWHWTEILYKLPMRMALDQIAMWRELLRGKPRLAWQILRANFHFLINAYGWRKHYNHCTFQKIKTKSNRLIIWDYFVKRKKRFSELMKS